VNVVVFGQNTIDLKAAFDIESKQIKISQTIQYQNTTQDTLNIIYLNDWSHSYATKSSPLAKRFAEEYKTEFHFAKSEDRGYTAITSIKQDNQDVSYERLKDNPDVIEISLKSALQSKGTYTLHLEYIVQVPNDKFTRYGITPSENLNLRYWYITPAIYNGSWQYFSNKNLDDLYIPKANLNLEIEFPNNYQLTTELNETQIAKDTVSKSVILKGDNRINNKLFLNKLSDFKSVETDYFTIVSNVEDEGLNETDKAIITDNIVTFIVNNLGDYPHEKLVLSEIDYKKDPIYGLNLLPNFVRPFPDNFLYELKLLKTALHNYLENILLVNPRKDQWLFDGLQTYFLMKYVEQNYPKMKIFGTLSNIWGVRSFHAAKLNFNDQYNFLYMHMARSNLDQPLNMKKDSLLKFNKNIANKYKAGVGLKYLDDYVNSDIVESAIKEYLSKFKLKETSPKHFETLLKSKTQKDINWFFDEYITTNKKIDFKIKKVTKIGDSIAVTIKNKRDNSMPISLFAMNNDSIISKTWINDITDIKTIKIPNGKVNKLVLNYDKTIPEFNLRDNWKSLKGFFFNNKPLQFRLFKDIEDPYYNQVFFMPHFNYNFYDGFSPGVKLYNKTLLKKPFLYSFKPTYAVKSKQLVGSASLSYSHRIENQSLHLIRYGLHGQYSNYAPDLSYKTLTPSIQLRFRNENDLRDNKSRFLNLRYLNISRDSDPTGIYNQENDPNYSIFNVSYGHSNRNLINYSSWYTDVQFAKNFGKAAFNFEYRKLTETNRQIDVRLFAGVFLYNNTYENSDFFSFALDRPTDYLFDYNYLGRSEDSGIFSQQIIIAEGGFKSKLETPFANQWITTLNASTTLWKYIQAYGDVGFVKNHHSDPKFVYDSGIRLSLVADYFELYFPVYSSLGWEIGQPKYDEKIRFIITLSPKTLLGLFTRRWY
jgi:hypothetical protein